EEIVQEAYQSGCSPNGTPDDPLECHNRIPPEAGYTYRPGGDSEYAPGYFAALERRGYDFQVSPTGQGRGLILNTLDPLGHCSHLVHDAYDLLPTAVTD